MKRSFLFSALFLWLLITSSCTHDVEQPSSKAIKGEWQWVYSDGGLGNDTIAPINNTLITLSLNPDSTYALYLNNEPQASGNYAIQTDSDRSILHLDRDVQINMLVMHTDEQIFVWDNSQLWLYDTSISDGFNHHFVKVQ